MKRAWHDPAKLTEATVAAYRKPLGVNHWDKGLWYFTQAARKRMPVYDELHELSMPVAVMTGDDDRLVATANSIALSQSLKAAGVEVQESVFESCGHVPQEECPEETLEALTAFLRKLQ